MGIVALGSSAPCLCAFWLAIEIGRNLLGSTPNPSRDPHSCHSFGFLEMGECDCGVCVKGMGVASHLTSEGSDQES